MPLLDSSSAATSAVKEFWERNPLSASAIDAKPGTPQFFSQYDRLREVNEPPQFAHQLHEYDQFAGKKVLEVGCGNAYTLAKYAESGAQVHGVDITETAIQISRARFHHRRLAGHFAVANAENLPYADDFFDCICSMGVLHHVPDEAAAISEIHRCLKPSGKLIAMFYHRWSLHYQFNLRLAAWRSGKNLSEAVKEVDGFGNPKGDAYTRPEVRRLLRGFDNLELFTGLINLPRFGIFMPSSFTSFLGKRLGWFLYVKGAKALD